MTVPAFPLQWPQGWQRQDERYRKSGNFKHSGSRVTIAHAAARIREQLRMMGCQEDDLVVSSNLRPRLDGYPYSGQPEPTDPGVAVYWNDPFNGTPRCMAIDLYDRVADNLAAIAATLEAMRAIERHGGAEILNRAFTGFAAIEDQSAGSWWQVLGVESDALPFVIEAAYKRLRSEHHPDRGGDPDQFHRVQCAYEQATA